jgi:hypothetical protein
VDFEGRYVYVCGKEILQEKGEKLSKIHEEKEGLK